LGVEIREIPSLKQWVVGEVDSRRHVLSHKCDLLSFRKEIVGYAIEHEATDRDGWQDFLRNQLGRIEDVEFESVCEFLVEQL
jgi:FtsZ-binding cell division protein ZapB